MKAILEFDLTTEREEFEEATNGWKWAMVVWEIDQHLRTKTKYASDDMPEDVYKALNEVREYLHDELRGSGLQLK